MKQEADEKSRLLTSQRSTIQYGLPKLKNVMHFPYYSIINFQREYFNDLYYWLLKISWPVYIVTACLAYVTVSFGWCLCYHLVHLRDPCTSTLAAEGGSGNACRSFAQLFIYVVQILTGVAAAELTVVSVLDHALIMGLTLTKVLLFSLWTSLVFVRFARPVARIQFSDVACIGSRRGKLCLTFRLCNLRFWDVLINPRLDVTIALTEKLESGSSWRSFHDVVLVRSTIPGFSLPWTAMHTVDEKSPLYGKTAADLAQLGMVLFVNFSAHDPVYGSGIYTQHQYPAANVLFQKEFVDQIEPLQGGKRMVDLARLSETRDTPDHPKQFQTSMRATDFDAL